MPKKKKATPKSDFFTNIIILARVNTIKFNSYSLYCTQFEIVGITENADYLRSIYIDGFEKYDRGYINGKRMYSRLLIKKVS